VHRFISSYYYSIISSAIIHWHQWLSSSHLYYGPRRFCCRLRRRCPPAESKSASVWQSSSCNLLWIVDLLSVPSNWPTVIPHRYPSFSAIDAAAASSSFSSLLNQHPLHHQRVMLKSAHNSRLNIHQSWLRRDSRPSMHIAIASLLSELTQFYWWGGSASHSMHRSKMSRGADHLVQVKCVMPTAKLCGTNQWSQGGKRIFSPTIYFLIECTNNSININIDCL